MTDGSYALLFFGLIMQIVGTESAIAAGAECYPTSAKPRMRYNTCWEEWGPGRP